MSDSLFVLKTDFDMITYELRDKTEFLAQNIMRLILEGEKMKQRLSAIETRLDTIEARLDAIEARLDAVEDRLDILEEKFDRMAADMNRMDAKLDLIIKHLKI